MKPPPTLGQSTGGEQLFESAAIDDGGEDKVGIGRGASREGCCRRTSGTEDTLDS